MISNWSRVTVAAVLALSSGFLTIQARADEFVDRVNDRYKVIQQDKRSDLIILPILHKLEAVPASVADPLPASLMTTASANWPAVETWCKAKPQTAALEALKKITSEDDYRKAWAFGQPYGASAVPPEYIDMGLYTELGENPTLASAEFKYLPVIRKFEILVHVEATRLLAEGKGNDALELMRRWVYFAAQIADRQFLKEKTLGMEMMTLGYQRMRDLAYTDSRSEKPTMTPEGIRDVIQKISLARTPIAIERITLPQAERDAGLQLVARTFVAGAKADTVRFPNTFAVVAAGNRPLRRFSENAKWDGIRALHANTADTTKAVNDVFGDWEHRWELRTGDPLLDLATDYQQLDKVKFAMADLVLGDLGSLFPIRAQLRAEAVGTRGALAVQGFKILQRSFPPSLEGTTPAILPTLRILVDPFDKNLKEDTAKRVQYFRPTKDTPKEHTIRLFPKVAGISYPNFEIKLREDNFVLYSAGPDGVHNGMSLATQMTADVKGDYLIWPPMLSLVRQNLSEQGKLP